MSEDTTFLQRTCDTAKKHGRTATTGATLLAVATLVVNAVQDHYDKVEASGSRKALWGRILQDQRDISDLRERVAKIEGQAAVERAKRAQFPSWIPPQGIFTNLNFQTNGLILCDQKQ